MISAIVLTKNEEKFLPRCLKSLSWCSEVVVIDDYSTDETVKIAKQHGAKVYKRELNNNFANQRNYGLKKTTHDWVFFVDADEMVPQSLAKEIQVKLKSPQHDAYLLKRNDYFWDQKLKYGETSRVNLVRLGKKSAGRWQGQVHEVWKVKGTPGQLKNKLEHQRGINVSQFLKKINQYSSTRANQLYSDGIKTNAFLILAYPIGKFIQNYFLRLGFLDKGPGFVMALMMSFHSFLVRAKLYTIWQNDGKETVAIPPLKEIEKKYG